MRVRASVWRLLSLGVDAEGEGADVEAALAARRRRYWASVASLREDGDPLVASTLRQLRVDVPRMSPPLPAPVRRRLERVLLVWAAGHRDAGYVQGMNDVLAPVLQVLLLEADAEAAREAEADAHSCLCRLLGGVADFYTEGRPGLREAVRRLEALVRRVDTALHRHLAALGVDYVLFALRWLNNLLTRELPARCVARLWDTLLAEEEPKELVVYVCAAFLRRWRERLLLEKDFNGVVMALQALPTHRWGGKEVDALLAEAFRLQAAFADAPSHLQNL